MKYYYRRPDSNAETFKFQWFRSGDEGFYQEDERGRRFFFITGRLKELINRGGVKFSPFDIEEELLKIAGVKVGLAIAFENDYYGERGDWGLRCAGRGGGVDGRGNSRPMPPTPRLRQKPESRRLRY
jgi:non-ribosomal peptide synthetase component E (peptide arylation enzyme)